jgi:two-component system, chemotaxis family, CheB/CheR fusion protein
MDSKSKQKIQASSGARTQLVKEMETTLEKYEAILATIREPLVVLDAGLKIKSANDSFYKSFSVKPEDTEGKLIYDIGNRQWDIPELRRLLEEILPKNTKFNDFEVTHEFPGLGRRTMLLNARRLHDGGKETQSILLAIEDITERKRLEYEMETSELRYRRLFETARDGILILDAATGQISDVNPFLIEMLGYQKEEFLGRRLWEISPFKDTRAGQTAFTELQTKGYIRYSDLPLETKDGRSIAVEFVSNVYQVNGQQVIQCNIRDNTARKASEEALKQSETLYHHLFENMIDGFAYCRMVFTDGQPADFIYLSVNDAFEKLTGLKDVLGKSVTQLIPRLKETNPELFEIYGRVSLTGTTERFETYISQLATWFSVSVYRPEKGYFVAVFENITARKQAEQALEESGRLLRENEERLHLAQDAANAGAWEWDLRTNKNYWSERVWKLYGIQPNSIEPSYEAWAQTIHPDDRPDVEKAVRDAAGNGKKLSTEWRVNGSHGNERWLMSVGQPVTDTNGKVIRYLGIVIDITERKRVELMKDEFIGLISHELKTPITVIMGSINTALTEGISPQTAKELLENAASSTGDLADIIDNLLELSRAQANRLIIRKEPVDLAKTILTVVNKIKTESDMYNLIVDIPGGLPDVPADILRVERILVNLIGNAIKYSPKGGVITISVTQKDGFIMVGIENQGIGISIEDQSRLFKPFERLETADGIPGTGLGLTVCRRLVEAHGGTIWVESEPGNGATFFFTLPSGEEPA